MRLAGRAGVRAAVGRADADDTVVPMGPLMSACFGGNAPLLDRGGLAALRALREDRYWVLLELEAQLERAALEHRVSHMRPDHVDPDLLDSQVRSTLDLTGPDEIVIVRPAGPR